MSDCFWLVVRVRVVGCSSLHVCMYEVYVLYLLVHHLPGVIRCCEYEYYYRFPTTTSFYPDHHHPVDIYIERDEYTMYACVFDVLRKYKKSTRDSRINVATTTTGRQWFCYYCTRTTRIV